MIINWVCACPGEADWDVYISCKEAGIECRLFILDYGWHFNSIPGVEYTLINKNGIKDIPNANLTVLRYPQMDWPRSKNLNKTVAWTSEQGPTRGYARNSVEPYPIIAANNKLDEEFYKKEFPNKMVLYLPFGGRVFPDLEFTNEYDIISSCVPHYACRCENGLKARSVDTMLSPLIKDYYNIALYGLYPSDHGWEGVKNSNLRYAGNFNHWEYEKYLSKAKLYVDVTFNWEHGGFGCKLGRALATGIPVIWHKTAGMELEGFVKGDQLDWSASPEETKELVDFYLNDDIRRVEMGKRGKAWFLENWSWSKNLERIANGL